LSRRRLCLTSERKAELARRALPLQLEAETFVGYGAAQRRARAVKGLIVVLFTYRMN
jgi:hypothetical protein